MTAKDILKKKHTKWTGNRGALEYALRDAYSAGSYAAYSRSVLMAVEYADREAPKIAEMLADEKEKP